MRSANWPRIISWIDFGGTVGDDSGTHHTFLCGKIFIQEKKNRSDCFYSHANELRISTSFEELSQSKIISNCRNKLSRRAQLSVP